MSYDAEELENKHKANFLYSALKNNRPTTKSDLRNYVKVFAGINVPDRQICLEHSSPMDYLWHCFSADFADGRQGNADAVVWANRAGGKTKLAAVATLLDCIFKPGCKMTILGGSLEQSSRMYEYLTQFIYAGFEEFLESPIRNRICRFKNGATVEVLTQSDTSVRGRHVNKLRCDEVELFDEGVLRAARFITHSNKDIVGAMEIISTMHRPYGLMQQAIKQANQIQTPVFQWCVWEVIEKCVGRSCSACKLWNDCLGRAKDADGYLKIDDCITQMTRSSRAAWESEMLCKRPSLENAVFAEFDPQIHIGNVNYDANLPLYRSIDFGFVNPFVCLWIQVDSQGKVRVIDEYIRSRATIDVHSRVIKERTPGVEQGVIATFCDPAGSGTSDITGTSCVTELKKRGILCRYRRSSILEGIELIRRSLKTADGTSEFVINPKCTQLIEAMRCYHYPDGRTAPSELPFKDGVYDHPIDTLRYFFVNYTNNVKPVSRSY